MEKKGQESTNIVKPARVELPEVKKNYEEDVAKLAKRLQAPTGSRVTISQSKTFVMPDGNEVESFQGIIVDFVSANFYYPKAFKRGEVNPPSCFAISEDSIGMHPSKNSPEMQSSEGCDACWANQWRSKENGKACQNTRLLAILPPDADSSTPVYLLKISPTGTRAFDGYIAACGRKFQRPPRGIITTFVFDEKSDYASVRFVDPAPVDDELIGVIEAKLAGVQEILKKEPDYE